MRSTDQGTARTRNGALGRSPDAAHPPAGDDAKGSSAAPHAGATRRRIDRLRARFGWGDPAPPSSRPALIVLSGLPGTGKSHLAAALAQRFDLVVLRSDEVRKELYPAPRYTSAENGAVYLTCYALLEALLRERYAVVFDATNLMRRGRRRAQQVAEAVGAPYLLLVTDSPPGVVAERLRRRAAGETAAYSSDADWLVHEKLAGTMEAISTDREPAVIVDTSLALQPAFDAIARLLGRPHPK